jgi:quercetin dioxygenase-like cupin family protein
MRRVVIILGFSCAVGLALGMIGMQYLTAQQPSIKRTDVLKTDMAGMEGKEAHMWVAEIAPGAATGKHSHPTPRFVYVMEGSVILEVDGKPSQTFKAGEGFQEWPDNLHNFRNASTTEPAKALGFQLYRNDARSPATCIRDA